jgi:hypothetical protein
MGREQVHRGFRWVNVKARGHLEELCAGGRIILKWIFKK